MNYSVVSMRAGFATNSSSTHTIILFNDASKVEGAAQYIKKTYRMPETIVNKNSPTSCLYGVVGCGTSIIRDTYTKKFAITPYIFHISKHNDLFSFLEIDKDVISKTEIAAICKHTTAYDRISLNQITKKWKLLSAIAKKIISSNKIIFVHNIDINADIDLGLCGHGRVRLEEGIDYIHFDYILNSIINADKIQIVDEDRYRIYFSGGGLGYSVINIKKLLAMF